MTLAIVLHAVPRSLSPRSGAGSAGCFPPPREPTRCGRTVMTARMKGRDVEQTLWRRYQKSCLFWRTKRLNWIRSAGWFNFADRGSCEGPPTCCAFLTSFEILQRFNSSFCFYAFHYTFYGTKLHQDVLRAYFNLIFTYWQFERLIVQIIQFKWSTISVM